MLLGSASSPSRTSARRSGTAADTGSAGQARASGTASPSTSRRRRPSVTRSGWLAAAHRGYRQSELLASDHPPRSARFCSCACPYAALHGSRFEAGWADRQDDPHSAVLDFARVAAIALLERLIEDAGRIVLDSLDDPPELQVAVLIVRIDDLECHARLTFQVAEVMALVGVGELQHACFGVPQEPHRVHERSAVAGDGAEVAEERACRSEERRVGKECRSRWSPY